jgi:hypothetical protein
MQRHRGCLLPDTYQGLGNDEASGTLAEFEVGCIYDVYYLPEKLDFESRMAIAWQLVVQTVVMSVRCR